MPLSTPCSRRAADWRRCAENLRDHVASPRQAYLQPEAKAQLLREAAAADELAEWWQNAAETEETAA